jgi:hypothetical protein
MESQSVPRRRSTIVSISFRPLLAILAVAAAALALAACGSDSSSSSTGSASSDEEKQLAFQDCLRREGLDVQIMDGGRGVAIGARAEPGDGPPQDAGRAMRTCHEKTGWAPPEPSDEEKSEMRDRALRFAQCMRDHGVDMDDPAPDGRMTMRVQGDSPTFRAAQEACGGGMASRSATPADGGSGLSDAP